MKIIRVYLIIFFLGALAITAVITSQVLNKEDQSSKDSEALYGGQLESGYPTGGYLVSQNSEGNYNYCSLVNIKRGVAVTAAHCVEDTVAIEIGFDSFIFEGDNNLQVQRIYRNAKWNGNNLNSDFA